MGGFSCWRISDKLLNFGKMIVKVLKCRWFISQNIAHFSTFNFPASIIILLSSLLQASWLGIFNVALLK